MAVRPLNGPAPALSDNDEIILEIRTAHGEMTDSITGHGLRRSTYLPLGAIAHFLDLPIAISDNGNYASGWFLDTKRTISLNLREHKLIVQGREIPLGTGDAAAYQGELYLRVETFSTIFPMSLEVDLRALAVTVKTREPFPFELKAAREAARDELAGKGHSKEHRYPRLPTPYRLLDWPLADVETRVTSDNTHPGAVVDNDLRLAGDIAAMTARLFVSTSSINGLTGARLELGRRDADGQLLGPLKGSEFQIGDVSTVSLPLGLRGISGRGVFVTSTPIQHLSVFDTIDLRGDLPDGYEVELYRNNILISAATNGVNGRYAFTKVPVDFGSNVFRLVFYGPQGQRREEVRRISVGDGRLAKGAFQYSMSLAQKDVSLFDIKAPSFTPTQNYGSWRAALLLEYGLSTHLTTALGSNWFETSTAGSGTTSHWQTYAGLRSSLWGVAVKVDAGLQDGGGQAVTAGLGGKIFGASWAFTHAEYAGAYTDEVRTTTGAVMRRASDLNFNLVAHFGGGGHGFALPLAGQVTLLDYADGSSQFDMSMHSSLSVSRFVVSNELDMSSSKSPAGSTSSSVKGSFDLASYSGPHTQYRMTLAYGISPHPSLSSGTWEVDHTFSHDTTVKATVSRVLASGFTQLGASVARSFARFSLGLNGSYGMPGNSYNLSLRLAMSFGRNPLSGRPFMALPGLAGGGAVLARTFKDNNGDGRLDSGDEMLKGVNLNTGSQSGVSNAHGMAFLGTLGDGNRVGLMLDSSSLPDIALAPTREGVELKPRAGRIQIVDFPVVALSDVEGSAYFGVASAGHQVSGLVLYVIDSKNKVVAHARTEADGYFLFEQLHPGDYTIGLSPSQAQSLKVHIVGEAKLHISPKGESLRRPLIIAAN